MDFHVVHLLGLITPHHIALGARFPNVVRCYGRRNFNDEGRAAGVIDIWGR